MTSDIAAPTPPHSKSVPKKWPRDLLILSFFTGSLWAITVVWILAGSGQSLEPPIRSEADAWLFALSGAALIYFLIIGVVASWSVILGIPTCFLAVSLCLRRSRSKTRLISAGVITAAIFMGIPMILNHQEEKRLSALYQKQDSSLPSSVRRAIEIPNETPRSGDFPIRCNNECLDLLTFGKADSVTRTFPKVDAVKAGKPDVQNFRIGFGGPDCAGTTFKNYCAHATDEGLPENRLVLTFETVAPWPRDAEDVYVRRLVVRDTAKASRAAAVHTQLVFARYPGLLNIAWGQGGLHLRRDERPIVLQNQLDARLYRAFIPNRTLNGSYFPFR